MYIFSQGPDEWETLNGNWSCNGRKQSPINIVTDQVMQKDPTNPPNLRLTVAGNKPITGELRNNGYAPTFFLGEELTVKLAGGLLQENYFLKLFHFHFGCNDTVGSEHTIDGNTYPIEVISNVFPKFPISWRKCIAKPRANLDTLLPETQLLRSVSIWLTDHVMNQDALWPTCFPDSKIKKIVN